MSNQVPPREATLGDRAWLWLTRPALGKRQWVAIAAGVIVIAAAGYWGMRAVKGQEPLQTFTVGRGDFSISITERGDLRALDSVTISAQEDISIIYLVPEGTQVSEGDLLVKFDASKYEVALEEAQAAHRVAQADLRKARKDLEAQRQKLQADSVRYSAEARMAELDLDELLRMPLEEDLERARIELERARVAFKNAEKQKNLLPSLLEKGFVTASALEEAELAYLEANASLQAATFEFERVKAGPLPQELEKSRIRLQQAQTAAEKAKLGMASQLESYAAAIERESANVEVASRLIDKAMVKLTRTELYAPREGLVVYATVGGPGSLEKIQLGMIPFEGQPLIYLPNLSAMVVDIEVNEIDIGKVTPGGTVAVRLEAYPDAVFDGRVLQIGALAKMKQNAVGTSSGIKAFNVTVQIDKQDSRLRPGLSAVVDIMVDERSNGMSVPLTAVAARGDDHLVFISRGGRVEEREVVLGPSNEHQVIVESGLRAGERILLTAPATRIQ